MLERTCVNWTMVNTWCLVHLAESLVSVLAAIGCCDEQYFISTGIESMILWCSISVHQYCNIPLYVWRYRHDSETESTHKIHQDAGA